MKRNILILLLLLVLAVALAACGGDKADEVISTPTTEPTTVPSTPTSEPTVPTTEPSAPTTEPSDPSTESSDLSTEPSEPTMPEYATWSEYVPGTIRLTARNQSDFPDERKCRALYYTLELSYVRLLSEEQQDDWSQHLRRLRETENEDERGEMLLVTLIKRYNIPRESVQQVVNKFVTLYERVGTDMWHEMTEIPNLDIIYTFDNEIINRFYRYE